MAQAGERLQAASAVDAGVLLPLDLVQVVDPPLQLRRAAAASAARTTASRCPGSAPPRRCPGAAAAGSRPPRPPARRATTPGRWAGRRRSPRACRCRPGSAPASPSGRTPPAAASGSRRPAPCSTARGGKITVPRTAPVNSSAIRSHDVACAVGQGDVLGRVDLPGLVGPRRPPPLDRLGPAALRLPDPGRPWRTNAGACGRRAGPRSPGRWSMTLIRPAPQVGCSRRSSRAGVRAGCPGSWTRGRSGTIRRESFGTPLSSSLQDASHRARGQTERLGQFGGRGALLMAVPERLPDRQRDRARHDWTSVMRHPRFILDRRIMPQPAVAAKD